MSYSAFHQQQQKAHGDPPPQYTRSEWNALSIRDRIRAMNATLDDVEDAFASETQAHEQSHKEVTTVGHGNNKIGPSFSDETAPSSSANSSSSMGAKQPQHASATATSNTPIVHAPPFPERSSVIDIWRKRESAAAASSTATTPSPQHQTNTVFFPTQHSSFRNKMTTPVTTSTSTAMSSEMESDTHPGDDFYFGNFEHEQEDQRDHVMIFGTKDEPEEKKEEDSPSHHVYDDSRGMGNSGIKTSGARIQSANFSILSKKPKPAQSPIRSRPRQPEEDADLTILPPKNLQSHTDTSRTIHTSSTAHEAPRVAPVNSPIKKGGRTKSLTDIWIQRGLVQSADAVLSSAEEQVHETTEPPSSISSVAAMAATKAQEQEQQIQVSMTPVTPTNAGRIVSPRKRSSVVAIWQKRASPKKDGEDTDEYDDTVEEALPPLPALSLPKRFPQSPQKGSKTDAPEVSNASNPSPTAKKFAPPSPRRGNVANRWIQVAQSGSKGGLDEYEEDQGHHQDTQDLSMNLKVREESVAETHPPDRPDDSSAEKNETRPASRKPISYTKSKKYEEWTAELSNPSKILSVLHTTPSGATDDEYCFEEPSEMIDTLEGNCNAGSVPSKLPKPSKSWKKGNSNQSAAIVTGPTKKEKASVVLSSKSSAFDAYQGSGLPKGPKERRATVFTKFHEEKSEAKRVDTSTTVQAKPPVRNHLPAPVVRRSKKNNENPPRMAQADTRFSETAPEESTNMLTPRARELQMRKQIFLAHRRKLAKSKEVGRQETALSNSSSAFASASLESASTEDHGVADEAIDLAVSPRRSEYPSEYTPFRVSAPNPNWPGSQAGQPPSRGNSDSFISENDSMRSGSSLTDRAEKMLQQRRRRQPQLSICTQNGTASRDEVKVSTKSPNNHSQPDLRGYHPSKEQSAAEVDARLCNRYNTADRFIEARSESTSRPLASEQSMDQTLETSVSMASSYRSAGTRSVGTRSMGTFTTDWTENDSRYTRDDASRRTGGRGRREYRRRRSDVASVASENFLAENASNLDAFRIACRSISISEFASDIVGEFNAIDFNKIASGLNERVTGCVREKASKPCHDMLFDVEDVAIEVEYTEGDSFTYADDFDDDPRRDFGVCSPIDAAVAQPSLNLEPGVLDKINCNNVGKQLGASKSFDDNHHRRRARIAGRGKKRAADV